MDNGTGAIPANLGSSVCCRFLGPQKSPTEHRNPCPPPPDPGPPPPIVADASWPKTGCSRKARVRRRQGDHVLPPSEAIPQNQAPGCREREQGGRDCQGGLYRLSSYEGKTRTMVVGRERPGEPSGAMPGAGLQVEVGLNSVSNVSSPAQ